MVLHFWLILSRYNSCFLKGHYSPPSNLLFILGVSVETPPPADSRCESRTESGTDALEGELSNVPCKDPEIDLAFKIEESINSLPGKRREIFQCGCINTIA